jgi:hypothetical protein
VEFASAPSDPAPVANEPAPIPSDPSTGLPVGLQATGVDIAALEGGGNVDPAAASAATPPADAPSQAEQVAALATQYGYDPAEFAGITDVATAQATINFLVNQSANLGYGHQQAPQQVQQPRYTPNYQQAVVQPPAPAQDPTQGIKPLDLKGLGLNEEDPASKAIRSLEELVKDLYGTTHGLVREQQAARHNQAIQAQQQLAQQIDTAIDGLANPLYGTSQTRTIVQRVNVDRLNQIATYIVNGEKAAGRKLPPVEAIIRRAQAIDAGGSFGPALGGVPKQTAVAPAPAPLAPVNPYASPTRQVAAPPAPKTIGLAERWVDNPEFRRQQGI